MRSTLERHLPVFYFALSVLLVAALLPTALRPPQPPPPSSAEFSPDAPPDQDHEVILSELSRGTTTTAGVGDEVGDGVGDAPGETEEIQAPRGCRFGFGDPPRQTESPYSPPCAPAFMGDNQGATWRGVTPTEVKIGIAVSDANIGQRANCTGRIPCIDEGDENDAHRTYRVWQDYFNEAFELYNRRVQFFNTELTGNEAVVQLDEEFEVFGIAGTGVGEEPMRRGLVHFGTYQASEGFYRDHYPYAWAWAMDGTKLTRFTTELACKQLAGEPPAFNNERDPSFDYSEPRKFGGVFLSDQFGTEGADEVFRDELEACGVPESHIVVKYLESTTDAQDHGTVMTQMRAEGVTTVGCYCVYLSAVLMTNAASNQGYYPEWLQTGYIEMDTQTVARLMNQEQWRHAFGVMPGEMERPESDRDYFRAYKQIDPDNDPSSLVGQYMWPHMFAFVSGLQMAGPVVTPQDFADGLIEFGKRPPDHPWNIGGGYAVGDYTYADYVALAWWDVGTSGTGGVYQHMHGGTRYLAGELPSEPLPWFEEDHPDNKVNPPPDWRNE